MRNAKLWIENHFTYLHVVDEMSGFFPQTITPIIPLTKELESLFEFLAHQKPSLATSDREFNELAQLSEKELDAKIRELENWNFRLNLDEAKETQDSISLGIISEHQQPANL
ncbi:hypothetical protein G195_004791 [Phytophthora kernoviae 00238/432]|uniref:Uncharacterized protein n=1 Tax=Phytophthora kernoviae 00238/432 TaxID=1284355 RepID=A0A8J4SHS1_9STRA|nr:hypothetical protein G195_004791 [Phytophthora kernoviae 00238/432]